MIGIQLNLLPDFKLEYIKAQRARRLVISISTLASITAAGLLIIMIGVNGFQKATISHLSKQITTKSNKMRAEPQITNILTVQNQLESLSTLHAGKLASPRLFGFLNEVTPKEVDITTLSADFSKNILSITGTSDSLSSVNKYVDTLKFTSYKAGDSSNKTKAFSDVVLTSFALSTVTSNTARPATYTITTAYDPTIFDINQKIDLTVPSTITTRSQTSDPTDLFSNENLPATDSTTKKRGN